MAHHLRPPRAGRRRLLLAAVAAALGAWPVASTAQPAGATAIHGQAGISHSGGQLVVTTQNGAGSQHSAIDWHSFSIPAGSSTRFEQPSVGSTSINRVTGNNPSRILGSLSSNGRLVLVNPAGIAVGAGAVVDTAGFTASTLRMSDADALAGRLRFGNDGWAGALAVDGRVTARHGDVVLIAPQLATGASALLRAHDGAVILAAGQKLEITGRGLEGIRMQVIAPLDTAVNLGTLHGDAVGIFAARLKHSGLIQAEGAMLVAGKLRLYATHALEVSGRISIGGLSPMKSDKGEGDKDKGGGKDDDKKDNAAGKDDDKGKEGGDGKDKSADKDDDKKDKVAGKDVDTATNVDKDAGKDKGNSGGSANGNGNGNGGSAGAGAATPSETGTTLASSARPGPSASSGGVSASASSPAPAPVPASPAAVAATQSAMLNIVELIAPATTPGQAMDSGRRLERFAVASFADSGTGSNRRRVQPGDAAAEPAHCPR